jgi:hypothetical protein
MPWDHWVTNKLSENIKFRVSLKYVNLSRPIHIIIISMIMTFFHAGNFITTFNFRKTICS